jgi:hypothetical protein
VMLPEHGIADVAEAARDSDGIAYLFHRLPAVLEVTFS